MSGSVLYPQGPLLIVDRGMRKKKKTKSYDTIINDEKDIKISVFKQDRTWTDGNSTAKVVQSTLRGGRAGSSNIRFVLAEPAQRKRSSRSHKHEPVKLDPADATDERLASSKRTGRLASARHSRIGNSPTSLPLSRSSPTGSASPIYLPSADDGIDRDSMGFLPFFLDATSFFYPLQHVLPLEFDPIPAHYLPEGLTDDCCVAAIIYTTAGRVDRMRPELSHNQPILYQQAISQLRKRISTGCVSDHTVCAVAMLAIYEYYCDPGGCDHEAHFRGMQQVVRARGGIVSLHEKIQTKILKVLFVPALDNLVRPLVPYLARSRTPIAQALGYILPEESISRVDKLAGDFHPVLFDGFSQLLRLAGAINLAIEARRKVHPYALDEDILVIQYQLLCLGELECSNFENCCRLAILAFTKILIRDSPFGASHCLKLTTAMRKTCSLTMGGCTSHARTKELWLWILVLGAIMAQNTVHRSWFFAEVSRTATSRGIATPKDLASVMTNVVWIPKVLNQHLFELQLPFRDGAG